MRLSCLPWLVLLAAVAWPVGTAPAAGSAAAGSIAGRITYVGRLPAPLYVFESGANQQILPIAPHKGLQSAVVYLASARPVPSGDVAEVVVNQKNWWFTPDVVAVRAGQPVRFTSEDSANHSVRSTHGAPANRFSAYTGTGEPYVHQFTPNRDYAPVVLTCDIHAWMMAWVYVFDHPHFAMTGPTGAFEIADLAPGTYRLSVRHGPGGLSKDVEVTVAAGKPSRVDVSFDTADLNLPAR